MASYKFRMRVAWADTDAAGIVHFSNYLRFFERAEEEMYHGIGLNFSILREKFGIILPRVESESKYLSSCKNGDELEIEIHFSQIRKRSYEERFTMKNVTSEKLAVEGRVVTVAASPGLDSKLDLPSEFISKISRFQN